MNDPEHTNAQPVTTAGHSSDGGHMQRPNITQNVTHELGEASANVEAGSAESSSSVWFPRPPLLPGGLAEDVEGVTSPLNDIVFQLSEQSASQQPGSIALIAYIAGKEEITLPGQASPPTSSSLPPVPQQPQGTPSQQHQGTPSRPSARSRSKGRQPMQRGTNNK
eukprot:gnl/MRDRNA2_/MRDRNA2_84133_c0_seq2.p1 gnl/MRDRNA2_/MRDRNA2_84133_c0~~gnl/MRDRNA2_/MRDRNA2_84133_c0_seq2.p1  ORF type:complete len:175 (+),score=24.56 gnl/MRDRNA2_/MRDRNA2_84133_c0_seq2:32-526(+)